MNSPLRIPEDPQFPRLSDAMNAEIMTDLLKQALSKGPENGFHELKSCQPEYIRYKPGTSCVIGYRLLVWDRRDRSRKSQEVYGRFLAPENGRREFEKARRTHTAIPPFGPPMIFLEDLNMVISFFPNDRSLRGLRFLLDPDKLKRIAQQRLNGFIKEPWWIRGRRTTTEMLSYKPERHCVVRCHLGLKNIETRDKRNIDVIAKMLRHEEGTYIYDTNQEIWESYRRTGDDPIIPEPLAFDPNLSLFFQEEVTGTHPFPPMTSPESWHSLLNRIGGRLRSFHQLHLVGLKPYPAEEAFQDLQTSIVNAANVIPNAKKELLDSLEQLEKRFPEMGKGGEAPQHGDFHMEQILIGERGPVILDLDTIRLSEPTTDVANFTAHLSKYRLAGLHSAIEEEEAEKAFLKGYFGESSLSYRIELPYLWHKKASLVKLALSCLKYLPPTWQHQMDFYLREAAVIAL